ncbi:MAG: trypsin-like peptidase domain-containing protein [Pseudolysinimonas sp.]
MTESSPNAAEPATTGPSATELPANDLPAPATPAAASTPGAVDAEPTKKSNAGPLVAALAVGAILGGASGAGVAAWTVSANQDSAQTQTTSPQTITVNDTDQVTAVTAVAAKASPSVVTISVTSSSAGGTGSGIVLSSDGYVLTNTHVVTLDGASSDGTIEVTTYDGKLYKATVVGIDPIVDLAVIKLEGASGMQPIEFADSSNLNVGDQAVAIGAPLGLSNTVTDGIVSALNRSIQIASSAVPEDTSGQDSNGGDTGNGDNGNGDSGPFDFWNFGQDPGASTTTQSASISLPVVQTDAAINPGNSGGALVNSAGELIGVNVAIASAGGNSTGTQSGSIGVGFAIPSNLAKRVADEIIADGSASHGLLGATVKDASSDTSDTVGAEINEVTGGGAAETAGLKPGDVVTAFNGNPITSSTDLTAQVRALAAGTTTSLTYVRDGKANTADVKLGELK